MSLSLNKMCAEAGAGWTSPIAADHKEGQHWQKQEPQEAKEVMESMNMEATARVEDEWPQEAGAEEVMQSMCMGKKAYVASSTSIRTSNSIYWASLVGF